MAKLMECLDVQEDSDDAFFLDEGDVSDDGMAGLKLKRVLLIEDNSADAKLVSIALQGPRHQKIFDIRHVSRLGQALDILDTQSFDVVLMDINLLDNHDTAAVAVLHARIPNTPIIVYSGVLDAQARNEVLEYGACNYVSKGWGSVFPLRYLIKKTLTQGAPQGTA